MSGLQEFVLGLFQANGALVEPPRYGAYEVLLPEKLAAQLDTPALQEIVFGEPGQAAGDGRLHLAQGDPLVDRLVEWARRAPAPARTCINSVRLDKRGLLELARQALTIPNGRLAPAPGQMEAPALFHYLIFTFKVTLATDEKHEHLVSVALDAQAGWPVDWQPIHEHSSQDEEPAFEGLPAARPLWIAEASPLTPPALAGLFERAQSAVLEKMAGTVEGLSRRAARYLELDQARLEQYYGDLAHDLERRLQRADDPDRQATLTEKLASLQAERELKLADAQARYQLRSDLELVTVQVVVQPKLALQVLVENRGTAIPRRVVWDPLLHTIEPLRCDVCGRPGTVLQLCSGGHLAHAGCLLDEQCVDCKRVYCRVCREQMSTCAVCGRPTCLSSLNRCRECGRGTCREHTGLCHAAGGAPAAVAAPARPEPARSSAPAKRPAPRPKAQPSAPARPARPAPQGKPAPAVGRPAAGQRARIEVQAEWGEAAVTAYVLTGKKRGPAVRSWWLSPEGIGVECRCEKPSACRADGLLLRPAPAQFIEAQMRAEIEKLRQEYGVPAHSITYTVSMHGAPAKEPSLILRGRWKDEETLARAQAGFDAVYARQHAEDTSEHAAPAPPRALTAEEEAEAGRFLRAAWGLLRLEGTLKQDELYHRVWELMRPGPWCTWEYVDLLLRRNWGHFKVQASGLVAAHEVKNVQQTAKRKSAVQLPPRQFTLEELLAAGEAQSLSEREAAIEGELRELSGPHVNVRAIQGSLRNSNSPAEVVEALVGLLIPPTEDARPRIEALVEELSQHTSRYELGGRTPAEVAESTLDGGREKVL